MLLVHQLCVSERKQSRKEFFEADTIRLASTLRSLFCMWCSNEIHQIVASEVKLSPICACGLK